MPVDDLVGDGDEGLMGTLPAFDTRLAANAPDPFIGAGGRIARLSRLCVVYDAPSRPKDFGIRTLSTLDLDRQVGSDRATWLDRELVAKDHLAHAGTGFGQEVKAALDRRAARLVEMGHAGVKDGFISIPRRTIAALERQEIDRVGKEMAAERGLTYSPSRPGEYVSGLLAGVANLASGRFAMIEDGLGFQLVPWQPVLEKRLDQHISGVRRDDGGIEWSFSRKRQIGLGL
jgi:hypothetical protein